MTLDEFIDKVCQRPLPQNPMDRVRTLAKELSEGASEGVWDANFVFHERDAQSLFQDIVAADEAMDEIEHPEQLLEDYVADTTAANYAWNYSLAATLQYLKLQYRSKEDNESPVTVRDLAGSENWLFSLGKKPFRIPQSIGILRYICLRWSNTINTQQYKDLLEINGFVDEQQKLTKAAFDLLEETAPSTIFISYRRRESSAFALLVLARLKQEGLEPFLDLALEPGEDWHAGLKERIQSRDFFILLLGKTTLESHYVIKEIEWALEKSLAIIPIWQPGFEFKADEWPDLPDSIKHKLSNTHRIKVQETNPLEYDKALTELLNRFGITP